MRVHFHAVADQLEFVEGIWNYYFVKGDGSMGVHNAKYTAALLRKTLGLPIIADVTVLNPQVPQEYALSQNYPNPFNPSTKISWHSPESGWQSLKIYDVLGNEIATLVNEEKPAGEYEVEFNSTSHSGEVRNLPSGIYFYQLRAGKFIQTRKMVYAK